MSAIFSPRQRATQWRKLWLWLAEAEQHLGLTQITDAALDDIRAHLVVSDDAFKVIAAEERVRRHDVMSHIFALEQEAPAAKGLLHIGATSCFVCLGLHPRLVSRLKLVTDLIRHDLSRSPTTRI
jgi:adenylosuccinate lyase